MTNSVRWVQFAPENPISVVNWRCQKCCLLAGSESSDHFGRSAAGFVVSIAPYDVVGSHSALRSARTTDQGNQTPPFLPLLHQYGVISTISLDFILLANDIESDKGSELNSLGVRNTLQQKNHDIGIHKFLTLATDEGTR